jgi:hypothetical protein
MGIRDTIREEGAAAFFLRGLKWWIAGIVVLAGLAVTLYLWINFALVKFDLGEVEAGEDVSIVAVVGLDPSSWQEQSDFTTVFGISFVPRETEFVGAFRGKALTVLGVGELPKAGIKTVDVGLEPQRAVTSLGQDVQDCALRNRYGTYNYKCFDPKAIQEYVRPAAGIWRNEIVGDLFYVEQQNLVRQYREGLLGLTIDKTGKASLFYLVPGRKTIESKVLPEEYLEGGAGYVDLVTDPSGDSDGFLLYNRLSGKVRYFGSFKAARPAQEFQRQRNYTPSVDLTQCLLRSDTVYCYTGVSSVAPDSETGRQRKDAAIAPGELEQWPIGGGGSRRYRTEQVVEFENVLVTDDGAVYLQDADRLYTAERQGGQLTISTLSSRVESAVAAKGLFFTTRNGLFEYQPDRRRTVLRFSGERLDLDKLAPMGDEVTITAKVRDDDRSANYMYQLTDKPLEGRRWEDSLPYPKDFLPIQAMDYDGNTLYVQLVAKTKVENGKVGPDPEAFEDAKRQVEDQLRKDGFLEGGVEVVYRWA